MDLGRGGKDNEARLIQFLDALSTAIHRWHTLRIYMFAETSETIADAFQRYDFAHADKLHFCHVALRCFELKQMDQIITRLALAPSLRHLRWAPCSAACARAMVRLFPLERLASLYLGFYMLPSTIEVLRKCTHAEHITLYFAQPGIDHYIPPLTEPIYFQNLRVIEIVVMELDSPFLTLLHAPRLSILCLNYTDFAGRGSPPANSTLPSKLKELLLRCRSLQVLIINSLPYIEIPVLIQAPELQNIRILEIIYPDPSQFPELERALVEEHGKKKANGPKKDADAATSSTRTTNGFVPAPYSHKRKMQCKPLLDGALVIGWTDEDWDEEFCFVPESPSVRMCGRTAEWWRVIAKFEGRSEQFG